MSLGAAVYTGWISTSGRVTVTKFVPSTGRHHSVAVGATGVDDHNNPSLHVREDGRLMVFFSPHSGYFEPKGRVSRLYYRVATRRHSIARWGPDGPGVLPRERTTPTGQCATAARRATFRPAGSCSTIATPRSST